MCNSQKITESITSVEPRSSGAWVRSITEAEVGVEPEPNKTDQIKFNDQPFNYRLGKIYMVNKMLSFQFFDASTLEKNSDPHLLTGEMLS